MAILLILLALFGFVLGGVSEGSSSATASSSDAPVITQNSQRARAVKKGCTKVRIIKGASSQEQKAARCMYRPVSP